jgi:hypothetical protein
MNAPFDLEALRGNDSAFEHDASPSRRTFKKLVTGESTHTKSDLNKTLALFNPWLPLAVDMPPAPQMRRKSTEAIFDGCMERFRPIMMTKHCLA